LIPLNKQLLLLVFFPALTTVFGFSITGNVSISQKKKLLVIQYGIASYYDNKFQDRKTANGEQFDQQRMTAAHNNVPLNTWIRVTNLYNGKSVFVRVNDRLHPKNMRLVDLSYAAAKRLGYIGRGLTKVKVEIFGKIKPVAEIETNQK